MSEFDLHKDVLTLGESVTFSQTRRGNLVLTVQLRRIRDRSNVYPLDYSAIEISKLQKIAEGMNADKLAVSTTRDLTGAYLKIFLKNPDPKLGDF